MRFTYFIVAYISWAGRIFVKKCFALPGIAQKIAALIEAENTCVAQSAS